MQRITCNALSKSPSSVPLVDWLEKRTGDLAKVIIYGTLALVALKHLGFI